MDEHEDDVGPEVEDGVEFGVEEFPILEEDEEDEDETTFDPDTSEI